MKLSFLLTFLFFVQILSSQNAPLAIQNIQYINVEKGTSNNGTVVIKDGKIHEIGENPKIPENAKVVDGNGKWLIPGLVDAHIHLFQSGGIYTRPDVIDLRAYKDYKLERAWLAKEASGFLKRYLRCGITTVIDIGGPMYNYSLRDQFKNSKELPNLFLTGPLVSTYQPEAFDINDPPIVKVNSKEEAINLVKKQVPYKPDFIKIWYIALPTQSAESNYEIVEATIKESHSQGLKVAVHATQLNTAKLAIKAGADILVHSVDDPVDDEFIQMLLDNKVVYIPTLIVHGEYIQSLGQDLTFSKEDFSLSNPEALGSLFDARHLTDVKAFERYKSFLPQMKLNYAKQDSIRKDNLKKISQHPVVIATGTDAGNIGTLHASSYYEEIQHMQLAGMSNAAILQASTINGAKTLGREKELGSIETGKIADLIILNQNPLKDINAIKDFDHVIKGGKLHQVDTLLLPTPEELVQQQVNGYNARDIEAFLEPYSDDFEIYNFPAEFSAKGKEKIRPGYESMFKNMENLHCEIVNRMVLGNTVIDQERVTGIPGRDVLEAIAIYKIENHKIAKVYFISKE